MAQDEVRLGMFSLPHYGDKMMGVCFNRLTTKFTSARFMATMMVVGTYCICMLLCIWLVVKNKLSIEAFLGIFASFAGLAALVIKSYFDIERAPSKEEGNKV